jgi:TetR/AcrR family transcriptional regulator, regulator of cefoperazone and chloramphenicol sensitivity
VPNIKNNASAQETRRLLLQAAGEVFAERGFHQATIKEITDRAGASIASVNYHFQDKAELYAAVIRNVICDSSDLLIPEEQLTGPPTERFRQFLRHFVTHLLHREGCGSRCRWWERVLVAREIANRSPTLDPMVEGVVRPLCVRLSNLATEVAGRTFSQMESALVTSSIMGQCLHYMDHREIIARLYPHLRVPEDADAIADHIANFSIAGIRASGAVHAKKPHRRLAK